MIRLKELLNQLVEKRAARMAENDAEAAAAAKAAGLQSSDDTEIVSFREPASPEMEKLGQRYAFEPTGPTVQKQVKADKRSGMQSDTPLQTRYKEMQDKKKEKEALKGAPSSVSALDPKVQRIAAAQQDKYKKDMAAAQSDYDAWEKERKDIADKETAQKAAVKAASVKQKGDKYMVDPSVGAIELPDRGSDDEVDLTTVDQSTLDAVKTKYQDYLRYKPSGAEASDYMRLLLKKYKLPPNTKPFKAPPSQQS